MNPIKGEIDVDMWGRRYTMQFDWSALAEVSAMHGDSPNLFSPDVVASVAAIGFKRHHPDITEEKIKELSPPLVPFARVVQTALQYAYFGLEEIPPPTEEDQKKNKSQKKAGLWRRIMRRYSKE
jgi:hypothetical protein